MFAGLLFLRGSGMFKRYKRLDFSKKLLVFIEMLLVLLFILTCIAVIKGNEGALTAFITGTFSLAAIAFGFYYWKAKNENIKKNGNHVKGDNDDN